MQGLRISPGLLPPECEALRAEVRAFLADAMADVPVARRVRNWAGSNPEFTRKMAARGWGRVINISSIVGRIGNFGQANYAAAKAGLIGFTKTLAREMASKNIQLNVVCPGLTETNMLEQFMQGAGNPEKLREAYRRAIPAGRLGKPEDLPGAILFFASDDADFITGQVLSVSGGLTMHG